MIFINMLIMVAVIMSVLIAVNLTWAYTLDNPNPADATPDTWSNI
jgi:hypothetical protein